MSKKLRFWLIFLIFLNGYISLSFELIVLRQLAFWVGSSAVITSIIMGTFLGFMSLGYFLGSSEKIPNKKIKTILSASFIIIAAFACLAASFPLVSGYFNWLLDHGVFSSVIQTFIFSFVLLSIGPFLFGFNTTLLSRYLHKYNTNYTGNIMAWDTIGSVVGSLLTTLLLMPFVGVNNTVSLIVLLAVLAAIITHPKWWVMVFGAVIIIPTVIINSDYVQRNRYGILVNNALSTISVDEWYDGSRILFMNQLPMSIMDDNGNTAMYAQAINTMFINTLPNDVPQNILVLGAGGFSVGLHDTFNSYTYVDVEPTLKDISEKYFLKYELTPNKKFVVQDASQFLKNTPDKYKIIVLDVFSNSYQIPEGLITAEFMERLKSHVDADGILVVNVIQSWTFKDKWSQVFDNTFRVVFGSNYTRYVPSMPNPWYGDDVTNVLYVWFNSERTDRIYTINRTPVVYDRYVDVLRVR